MLSWLQVGKKVSGTLSDVIWIIEVRLPDIILVLLCLGIPILMACLQETVAFPPDPDSHCISIIATDSAPIVAGAICFVKDFGAQWYHNIVKFPAAISGKCEAMADEQAKKECEERKSRRINQVATHVMALGAGLIVALPFR